MMNFIKKNDIVIPPICSIIGCIYILYGGTPLLVVDNNSSFHFNLITVNALFGGFLYTNYSLLLGLLDNAIIEKVKHTQIIKRRNLHILKGIYYATISVIAGLVLILLPTRTNSFLKAIHCLLQNIEIVYMIFLIFYFLLSIREMKELIDAIHNCNNIKTLNDINLIKEEIRRKNISHNTP